MDIIDIQEKVKEMMDIIDECPAQESFRMSEISKQQDDTINVLYEKLDDLYSELNTMIDRENNF